jgi:hypothetical protein
MRNLIDSTMRLRGSGCGQSEGKIDSDVRKSSRRWRSGRSVNTVVARKEKKRKEKHSSIALDVEFEFADRSGQ